eukprot:CAMPEP_0177656906 /NCGR_PEP_ID=MMETSP0447-20121125/15863_1 /TAXON_ID=0 /ORGANISM="Stygamoeba regulata, Strain BSH-02190019" /LENGTH=198 /DNA_ID=CAMNT_0019161149 /DNA_START=1 /DNA_END=594 /DNA_ORIENTATION=+
MVFAREPIPSGTRGESGLSEVMSALPRLAHAPLGEEGASGQTSWVEGPLLLLPGGSLAEVDVWSLKEQCFVSTVGQANSGMVLSAHFTCSSSKWVSSCAMCCCEDGAVYLWRLSTSSLLQRLSLAQCPLTTGILKKEAAVVASSQGDVYFLEYLQGSTLSLAQQVRISRKGVNEFALRHDSRVLAAACWDGRTSLFDW